MNLGAWRDGSVVKRTAVLAEDPKFHSPNSTPNTDTGQFITTCIYFQGIWRPSCSLHDYYMHVGHIQTSRHIRVVVVWKKVAPKGSGTVRRYGLVGGSVSLWRWALRFHICLSHAQWDRSLPFVCTRCITLNYLSSVMAACTLYVPPWW